MIKEITAKTLLSSVRQPDPWFGIKYTMNLYRGCQHQCIYCDSRSECYQIENSVVSRPAPAIRTAVRQSLLSPSPGSRSAGTSLQGNLRTSLHCHSHAVLPTGPAAAAGAVVMCVERHDP